MLFHNQVVVVSMLGICDEVEANKTRRDMIMTGINSRINGGGGNGGNTSGNKRRDKVNTTMIMIDPEVQYLTINLCTSKINSLLSQSNVQTSDYPVHSCSWASIVVAFSSHEGL